MDSFEQLRKISLFNDLSSDVVRSLAARAHVCTYGGGQRIVSQADKVQAFFIVLSGRVKISRSNSEGKEQILYVVNGGQPFCFCSAFTDKPYPVDVETMEQSLIARIPAKEMEDMARREPLLLLGMLQVLSGRLLDAMNMVESLSLHDVTKRVACFLLHAEKMSPGSDGGERFRLTISHKDVARIVGTTPETLSRVLQGFKRENIIQSSGRCIQILDRQGIQQKTE